MQLNRTLFGFQLIYIPVFVLLFLGTGIALHLLLFLLHRPGAHRERSLFVIRRSIVGAGCCHVVGGIRRVRNGRTCTRPHRRLVATCGLPVFQHFVCGCMASAVDLSEAVHTHECVKAVPQNHKRGLRRAKVGSRGQSFAHVALRRLVALQGGESQFVAQAPGAHNVLSPRHLLHEALVFSGLHRPIDLAQALEYVQGFLQAEEGHGDPAEEADQEDRHESGPGRREHVQANVAILQTVVRHLHLTAAATATKGGHASERAAGMRRHSRGTCGFAKTNGATNSRVNFLRHRINARDARTQARQGRTNRRENRHARRNSVCCS